MTLLLSSSLFVTGILLAVVRCDDRSPYHIRYIAKRATAVTECAGGMCQLKQGPLVKSKSTQKQIKDEANDGKHERLLRSYEQLTSNKTIQELFKAATSNAEINGLKAEETKAIFIYSMDSDNKAFYKDFKKGFREGEDRYPVFHYWLQKAVDSLPSVNSQLELYRGQRLHLNASVGNEMSLSGFTSVSKSMDVAKDFSDEGCTIMVLTSKLGVDIENLAYNQSEREVLIPPQERFRVTQNTKLNGYSAIYLTPIGRVRRDTGAVYTFPVCCGNYHEFSVSLILAALVCTSFLWGRKYGN